MAGWARDGQGTHTAGPNVRQACRQPGEHGLRLAAQQVSERRRNATVGQMHHETVHGLFEQLHGQVRERALARRAVAELGRVGLQVGQKLGHVFDRQVGIHHQHIGRAANHAHRREVFDGVVGQFAARGGAGAMGGHVTLHQGVAVGRGLGRGLASDGAAATPHVVDHDVLAQLFGPTFAHRAGHQIRAPTRRDRHDVTHDMTRESGALRQGARAGLRQDPSGHGGDEGSTLHGVLSGSQH